MAKCSHFQSLVLKKFALLVNRYYYGFKIIMSINQTTQSPLALREGFHVVLLRALAERLQGRDWVLKGGTNLRPLLRQYPIQRRHRSGCGQGRRGRHATRHSGDAG